MPKTPDAAWVTLYFADYGNGPQQLPTSVLVIKETERLLIIGAEYETEDREEGTYYFIKRLSQPRALNLDHIFKIEYIDPPKEGYGWQLGLE